MNPFDYVNQILQTKKNIIIDEQSEKDYNPFIVNRALSYHFDCVLFANEMNRRHFLDKKMQNSFLLNTIRAKKRPFVKWAKSEKNEDIQCVKTVFGFSDTKAEDALRLLSKDQLKQLKELIDIGGIRK